MVYAVFAALLINCLSLWLIFVCHKKGGKHVLGCGLLFLLLTFVLTLILFSSFYGYVPEAIKESSLYEEEKKQIEFFVATVTFVPALFSANLVSKGLDQIFRRVDDE